MFIEHPGVSWLVMPDHTSDEGNGDEEADTAAGTTKDTTVSTPNTSAEASALEATAVVEFSADKIQDRLDDGKIAEALVVTATRLEKILIQALADRYDITVHQFEKLFGNKSLERYQQMTAILGMFDQHQNTLDSVVEYRNKLAHDSGYLGDLQTDVDEREAIESVLKDAVEFIDQVEL